MKTKKTYVLTLSKVFMKGHPRAGEPTGFKDKLLAGEKIHTIREGEYWRKVVDEVNAGRAVLSVREWVSRAYASKQVEITQFERLGWQRVRLGNIDLGKLITIQRKKGLCLAGEGMVNQIVANDGLSYSDFWAWFPKITEGGIIHFTDFRY